MNVTYKSVKKISGWLGFVDFEILKTLIQANHDSSNAAVEIGVHHGKSTLPITYFSDNRKVYIIDLFGDQEQNIDHSGSGNKLFFLKTMEIFNINRNRIVIDERMSNEVSPKDILDSVGMIDFFHIDGGHHADAVASDIRLACNVASDDCVIAIDDMFRPEWPEVSSAAFSSEVLNHHNFVLFAIGFNKGYWCRQHKVHENQKKLLDNKILSVHLHKTYTVGDRRTLVFQRYPLPEWGTATLFLWYLEIFHPVVYRPLSIIYNWIKKNIKRIIKIR